MLITNILMILPAASIIYGYGTGFLGFAVVGTVWEIFGPAIIHNLTIERSMVHRFGLTYVKVLIE